MAFGKKSSFANFIVKGSFFEAFIEYLSSEDACEEELDKLKQSRNAEAAKDFAKYVELWNQFRQFVLQGDLETAQRIVEETPYGSEMGPPEVRSVLDDLAEKTGDFRCYKAYWHICGSDSVQDHEYALTLLNGSLAMCPEGREESLKHLWFLINNTEKKEKLKYAEMGLEYFLKPNTFVPAVDAANMINIARSVDPKSKGAIKTEYLLFERDKAAIATVRPLIQSGDYDEAFEKLGGVDNEQTRRSLLRGAHENKADASAFVDALKQLYQRTKNPLDAFYSASAVWNCDQRKKPDELTWSMETALGVLDDLPYRTQYAAALLDALYLVDPYPLPDDVAAKLAECVLEADPENEIALECLAIAKEQTENKN